MASPQTTPEQTAGQGSKPAQAPASNSMLERAQALLAAQQASANDSTGEGDASPPESQQQGAGDDVVRLTFDGGVSQEVSKADLAAAWSERTKATQMRQAAEAVAITNAQERALLDWLKKNPAAMQALASGSLSQAPPATEGQNGELDFNDLVKPKSKSRGAQPPHHPPSEIERRLAQAEGALQNIARERYFADLDQRITQAIASVPEVKANPAAAEWARQTMRQEAMLNQNADLAEIARRTGVLTLRIAQQNAGAVQPPRDYRARDDGGWSLDSPEQPYTAAQMQQGDILNALLAKFRGDG